MVKLVYTVTLVLALAGMWVGVGVGQLAHATNESPFEHGYLGGISDGKASARDWGDVCDQMSTADLNSCLKGYDLGFKKGCEGMMWYRDPHPEYMTCADVFNATQK